MREEHWTGSPGSGPSLTPDQRLLRGSHVWINLMGLSRVLWVPDTDVEGSRWEWSSCW